jgi:prevent-host-death family protein
VRVPVTKSVGAYEAKTTMSALLDLVEGGQEIVITKHQRPVVRLVSCEQPAQAARKAGIDVI